MSAWRDEWTGLAIFDRINKADLQGMLSCIGGFSKSYNANSYIYMDGDALECVGVVVRGMVHMIKEDVWGGKTILAIVGPTEVFGETYVFGASNRSNVSFMTAEESEVLFLPFSRVLHTCAHSCAYHQTLVDNMVALIARKNRLLTEKLEVTTKRSIRAKILTYLSQVSQGAGSAYFTVPLGRIEMAEYLCVDRSALTRELKRMKDEGTLDYSGNTFRLL